MIRTLTLTCFLLAHSLLAGEKPNILWITSEDNDKFWLGCYGNKQASTPHLDQLAERSVRFDNFYSNAPVCAIARSTILNGIYAPSQGTQHMRSRHKIPAANLPYVHYLREAGYYCTNASKTDYNFEGDDKAIWHDCNSKAHYKNRAEGQPFFAIFNFKESHESSLFADKLAKTRESGLVPAVSRISPQEVTLRPYLPDLPGVRSDVANYHDMMSLLDQRVGEVLTELEEAGLSDDTLIFYYSDHGGVTPRGKRYLHDTGVGVPLLIHVPEKWKHLSPFTNGSTTEELTAFVDLAPTVLSLLGVSKPERMQGRAFLGSKRQEPAEDAYAFLFADRFDEIYGMRRGLTDGRWKYIRRFSPHNPAAPYSYYSLGQNAWSVWENAWKTGQLKEPFNHIWEKNQAVEELYDTTLDPWEIKNLAEEPAHLEQLRTMRKALRQTMADVLDTGLVPEPMFPELASEQTLMDYVATQKDSWPALIKLAHQASSRNVKHLPLLIEKLASPNGLERYWAAQGCLILGPEKTASAAEALRETLKDNHAATRAAAARALIGLGHREEALPVLLKELADYSNQYAQQNVVNILKQIKLTSEVSDAWVKDALKNPKANFPITRLAKQLAGERGL